MKKTQEPAKGKVSIPTTPPISLPSEKISSSSQEKKNKEEILPELKAEVIDMGQNTSSNNSNNRGSMEIDDTKKKEEKEVVERTTGIKLAELFEKSQRPPFYNNTIETSRFKSPCQIPDQEVFTGVVIAFAAFLGGYLLGGFSINKAGSNEGGIGAISKFLCALCIIGLYATIFSLSWSLFTDAAEHIKVGSLSKLGKNKLAS